MLNSCLSQSHVAGQFWYGNFDYGGTCSMIEHFTFRAGSGSGSCSGGHTYMAVGSTVL